MREAKRRPRRGQAASDVRVCIKCSDAPVAHFRLGGVMTAYADASELACRGPGKRERGLGLRVGWERGGK